MKRLVSKGIEVETVHKDAMAARHKVRVSIPAYGAIPDMDDLADVFAGLRDSEPRSMSEAKEAVLSFAPSEAPAPLSTDEFYATALRLIVQAEELAAQLPQAHHSPVLQALDWAFAAGVAVTTGRLRSKHLVDLEREAATMIGRINGGKGRWEDKDVADTHALIAVIDAKMLTGMTLLQAASFASKRSNRGDERPALSAKSLAERYRYHKRKRPSEEIGR